MKQYSEHFLHILDVIAANPDQSFSSSDVNESLRIDVSPRTVRKHIKDLLEAGLTDGSGFHGGSVYRLRDPKLLSDDAKEVCEELLSTLSFIDGEFSALRKWLNKATNRDEIQAVCNELEDLGASPLMDSLDALQSFSDFHEIACQVERMKDMIDDDEELDRSDAYWLAEAAIHIRGIHRFAVHAIGQIAIYARHDLKIADMESAFIDRSGILEKPIESLKIGTRCKNVLRAQGISTVGQLVETKERDAITFPNMGPRLLIELKYALIQHGLYLSV